MTPLSADRGVLIGSFLPFSTVRIVVLEADKARPWPYITNLNQIQILQIVPKIKITHFIYII